MTPAICQAFCSAYAYAGTECKRCISTGFAVRRFDLNSTFLLAFLQSRTNVSSSAARGSQSDPRFKLCLNSTFQATVETSSLQQADTVSLQRTATALVVSRHSFFPISLSSRAPRSMLNSFPCDH